MSIKGIDAQMMITRLPDNVREVNALQRKPENVQDALLYQAKLHEAQEQTRIAKMSEAEMENIRTDVDSGSKNAFEGGENESGSDEEKEGETAKTMMVPPGSNTIDIKV